MEQKGSISVPSAGDLCKEKPAAVGGKAPTTSHSPELQDQEPELCCTPKSQPTEAVREHHSMVADTVPHQSSTLLGVCLTGDKLCISSSTSYLWIVNLLPSCRQPPNFPPCFGTSSSSTSATAPDAHTDKRFLGEKYLNRK